MKFKTILAVILFGVTVTTATAQLSSYDQWQNHINGRDIGGMSGGKHAYTLTLEDKTNAVLVMLNNNPKFIQVTDQIKTFTDARRTNINERLNLAAMVMEKKRLGQPLGEETNRIAQLNLYITKQTEQIERLQKEGNRMLYEYLGHAKP